MANASNDASGVTPPESPERTGRRIVVLGLYNSGSTVLAGMLHRLGVNMGAPFFASSSDDDDNNYYEPRDLSSKLRRWWDEPRAIETVAKSARKEYLERWASQQESMRPGRVGVKHPLLALCAEDLVAAWGEDTRFVWAFRPYEDSVQGLIRRGWFRGHEEALCGRLWEALHAFDRAHDVTRIPWSDLHAHPRSIADQLAELAAITPTEGQREEATRFLKR